MKRATTDSSFTNIGDWLEKRRKFEVTAKGHDNNNIEKNCNKRRTRKNAIVPKHLFVQEICYGLISLH